MVKCIQDIVIKDFEKIKRLSKYLKIVATILNILELPIIWTLPHGLIIRQSYLLTKTTTVMPFMYSKNKINLKVTIKDKYDKNKQIRALMPNLIHYLDGSSLCLFKKFTNIYESYYDNSVQFYSVHDCFGTTMEKVNDLKVLLASVYIDIYSDNTYLDKFDKCILDNIESSINNGLDRENRTVTLAHTN